MGMYADNREKFMKQLNPKDVAVFFSGTAPVSTADSNYEFRPDKNFYYFTGLTREGFILMMVKEETSVKTTLFCKEPNVLLEKWVGRYLTKEQCTEVSEIQDVKYLDDFDQELHQAIGHKAQATLYLDLFKTTKDSEGLAAHRFAKEIQASYQAVNLLNAYPLLAEVRMIKSSQEVETIRKAIELTRRGLERVMLTIKPEMFEYEISAEFNYEIMKSGADGNAFETIAASGANAVILHYIENDDVMNEGELVLMDLGAQYHQYASDITRTYPVNGKYSKRQKEIYNLVLKAHDEVINIMKPGLSFGELNKKASEVISEGLIELGLTQDVEGLKDYYYHGVSHYMGLDTHDVGFRDRNLEAGMVLTVEPGIYIEEEGIGIRIEDDVLITEEGCEVLSVDILRTVDEIEAFMSHRK